MRQLRMQIPAPPPRATSGAGSSSRPRTALACAALLGPGLLLGCGARSALLDPEAVTSNDCPGGAATIAWSKAIVGAAPVYDEAAAVAADADGSLFLTGVGALDAPPCSTVAERGSGLGFLAKLDARGQLVWQWRTGQNLYWASTVSSDGAGGALFVISVNGGEDLGTGPLAGGRYVGRADADGNPVFLHRIASGGDDLAGLATSPVGGIVVASTCNPPLADNPLLPLDSGTDVAAACAGLPPGDAVATRFSPSGEVLWTEVLRVAPPGYVNLSGAAFTATGGVVLAGGVTSTLTYGDGTIDSAPGLVSPGSDAGLFVARYDEHGALGAHRLVPGTGVPGQGSSVDFVTVSVDQTSDAVLLGGTLYGASGAFDLGGGPMLYAPPIVQESFLARLDPSLAHVWSFGFGGDQASAFVGLHGDGESGVIAITTDEGTFHLGSLSTPGPSALWVGHLALVGADGGIHDQRAFDANITGVALGAGGAKIMTGNFDRPAVFGADTLVPAQANALTGFVTSGPLW